MVTMPTFYLSNLSPLHRGFLLTFAVCTSFSYSFVLILISYFSFLILILKKQHKNATYLNLLFYIRKIIKYKNNKIYIKSNNNKRLFFFLFLFLQIRQEKAGLKRKETHKITRHLHALLEFKKHNSRVH